MRHSWKIALTAGLAMTSTLSTAAFADELPGKGIKVQPVQSTIAEETFQTLIVNKAMEKLGYDVLPTKQVDYNVAYTSIAEGDATYMATSWEPLHDGKYAKAGGDKKFYREGTYVTGAAQGYLIDKKTADKYHITNIKQFQDPKIAKLFDANGNGKADLSGCNPGWGCETAIEHHLDAYKLRKTVEDNQGQYATIMADTIARYRKGQPIFYYTWTPYWVSGVLVPGKDVVWLQVPFSAVAGKPNLSTKLPNGKNYGFPMNVEKIVANKKFAQNNPAAAELFKEMKLSINDINAENMMMRKGHGSKRDIEAHANGWIKAHQKTFDGWIKAAKQAAAN